MNTAIDNIQKNIEKVSEVFNFDIVFGENSPAEKNVKDFIKQSHISFIESEIERLEVEKKSVQELFPNSQINIPTYKLGCETKANKAYNKALQDQIDYLKAEKAIILKM